LKQKANNTTIELSDGPLSVFVGGGGSASRAVHFGLLRAAVPTLVGGCSHRLGLIQGQFCRAANYSTEVGAKPAGRQELLFNNMPPLIVAKNGILYMKLEVGLELFVTKVFLG